MLKLSVSQGFKTADKNLKEIHECNAEPASSGSTGVPIKTEPVHRVSGKSTSTSDGGA